MTAAGPEAALRAASGRLLDEVSHWTPQRWSRRASAPGRPAGATRADVVFELVQQLADLAADAERRPRRAVPRLDNDLAIADQIKVMVDDLLRGDCSGAADDRGRTNALRAATAAVARITSIMR